MDNGGLVVCAQSVVSLGPEAAKIDRTGATVGGTKGCGRLDNALGLQTRGVLESEGEEV